HCIEIAFRNPHRTPDCYRRWRCQPLGWDYPVHKHSCPAPEISKKTQTSQDLPPAKAKVLPSRPRTATASSCSTFGFRSPCYCLKTIILSITSTSIAVRLKQA